MHRHRVSMCVVYIYIYKTPTYERCVYNEFSQVKQTKNCGIRGEQFYALRDC